MATLTSIATEVFDAVAAELDGVIKMITIQREVQGEYDPVTGTYPTSAEVTGGRAVAESERTIKDSFPSYIVTGSETLWFVAELTFPPKKGDSFSMAGSPAKEVLAVRDILENEELFRVLVI